MLIIECFSKVGHMTTGVPHGIVLVQVLFVIYTASLHCLLESLNESFHIYAEDTQIYMTTDDSPDSQQKPTRVYEAVSQWMKRGALKLNPGNIDILLVGTALRRNL